MQIDPKYVKEVMDVPDAMKDVMVELRALGDKVTLKKVMLHVNENTAASFLFFTELRTSSPEEHIELIHRWRSEVQRRVQDMEKSVFGISPEE